MIVLLLAHRTASCIPCGVTRRYADEPGAKLCISYYNVEIRSSQRLRYIGINKTFTKGEFMKVARVLAGLLGVVAIGASGVAMARVDLGVNIGVPAPVYVAPQPVYAPPPPVVYQPAPVYGAPAIVIGWHGDRYWDGHRYWNRDEWYRHGGHGGYHGHGHGHGHWR